MNKERDDNGAHGSMNSDVIDRYRQASAELGEGPAASVRASILAAAAREAGARPVNAARPRSRARWPLAAAATVMLSTLAVMLAIRTQEEMPQFSAAPGSARTGSESSAPPPTAQTQTAEAAPAKPAVPAVPAEAARERQLNGRLDAGSRPAPARTERPAALAKDQSDVVIQKALEADRQLAEAPVAETGNKLEQARQNAPASSAASPPPEPTTRSKTRTEQAAGAVAQAPPVDRSADARRDAPPAAPAPLAAAQSERRQTEETERKRVEESAAAWLERIIKLRREGRHDEADIELKRFRERYPQVQPPAEALNPLFSPGTR